MPEAGPERKPCRVTCCGGAGVIGAAVTLLLMAGIVYLGIQLRQWRAPAGVTIQEDAAAPRKPRVRPIREEELPLAEIPWDAMRVAARSQPTWLPAVVPPARLPKIPQRFDPRHPEPVNLPTAKLPWEGAAETARETARETIETVIPQP